MFEPVQWRIENPFYKHYPANATAIPQTITTIMATTQLPFESVSMNKYEKKRTTKKKKKTGVKRKAILDLNTKNKGKRKIKN